MLGILKRDSGTILLTFVILMLISNCHCSDVLIELKVINHLYGLEPGSHSFRNADPSFTVGVSTNSVVLVTERG